MAYVKPHYPELCRVCRRTATLVVCNQRNAPIAYYCRQHERQALRHAEQLDAPAVDGEPFGENIRGAL